MAWIVRITKIFQDDQEQYVDSFINQFKEFPDLLITKHYENLENVNHRGDNVLGEGHTL